MGKKRMISTDIVWADSFLDMPLSTQALYFHLVLAGDDDGVVAAPKRIQRMIGCSDDDFRLLMVKGFIIPFESGICVIRHWKVHNYIRADRYKKTIYTSEKNMLSLTEDGEYQLIDTDLIQIGIPNDNQLSTNGIPAVVKMDTQYKLNKINNNIRTPDGAQDRENTENQHLRDEVNTKLEQDKMDFEKIYAIYPKKRGRTRAFEHYRNYVGGKGRKVAGTNYRLSPKEIYLAVAAYVEAQEEAGTDLQFYQDFSTFMCKTVIDYLPEKEEDT